jgi:hypothetical protein
LTTATKAPVKQEKTRVGEIWCSEALRALHALLYITDLDRGGYLHAPPHNASLSDLLRVWAALACDSSWNSLRDVLPWGSLADLTYGLAFHDPINIDPVGKTVSRFCDKVASPHQPLDSVLPPGDGARKIQICEMIHEFLNHLDNTITEKLQVGERSDRIVAVRDFGQKIKNLPGSAVGVDNVVFAMGSLVDLPSDHHLQRWDPFWLYEWYTSEGRKTPAVVLGPADAATFNTVLPRAWYTTDSARYWTARCRGHQISQKISNAASFEAEKRLRDEGLAPGMKAPKVSLPDPKSVLNRIQPDGSWAEKIGFALYVSQHPEKYFPSGASVDIPDDCTIDELLDVRLGFDVKDEELTPVKWASERFANRAAGPTRHEQLRDMLLDVCRSLYPRCREGLAEGLVLGAIAADESRRTEGGNP